MLRPTACPALLCLSLIICGSGLLPSLPAAQPDVVLIVADDLGWGDLGCYGSRDLQTPALDQLAAEGQRWTNFYANCCVCSPTRASILSGCYPDRVGVPGVIRTHAHNSWGKLAAEVELLPELLAQQGYRTTCIGKWHLGLEPEDHPQARGFDEFHGFLGDMMDDYYDHLRHGRNYMRLGRTQINPAGHATTLFAGWAEQTVERLTAEPQPYFMYLAFNAPHTPIQPPPDALDRVQRRAPDMPLARAKLVALIEDMDRAIGQVLQKIEQCKRETLVVFVSDNGGQLDVGAHNGPYRDGKQSNYEGGLRIPAIFHWPGQIPAGSQSAAVGITMDLLPTLCQVAGATPPSDIDGQSLLAWLQQPDTPQPARELYFIRREGGPAYAGLTIEALRQGDWKLVHNLPTQAFELFDLQADPAEQHDVSAKHPAQLRQLRDALMLHLQRGGQVPWQAAAPGGQGD